VSIEPATREAILTSVDRLVREKVAPRAAAIDAEDAFPRDLWTEAAAIGLFGLGIPEEYDGLGRDMVTPLLISERLARVSAAFALTFNNTTDSNVPLVLKGSERLKRTYLPRLARGELVPCISISEPHGGSDVAGLKSQARRDGDHYVISGRKAWCTNGEVGDVFTIFAKTDPAGGSRGISAFFVERNTPGFSVGRREPLIGLRGSPVSELLLEEVRVPVEARLGEEGEGFQIAMLTLDESRLHCAATAIGVATDALERALDYARERTQFGRPIIEHQAIQSLLAELATELAAARALWEKATGLLSREHTRHASTLAAMAKVLCADLCMRISLEAVQIFGASGLSRAFPVERLMRDAKAFQIYDGTSQILRSAIGRQLQRSGLPFQHLEPWLEESTLALEETKQ
jgi:alkylation response protein AidB-like acyl-CoA dehydrogenase